MALNALQKISGQWGQGSASVTTPIDVDKWRELFPLSVSLRPVWNPEWGEGGIL